VVGVENRSLLLGLLADNFRSLMMTEEKCDGTPGRRCTSFPFLAGVLGMKRISATIKTDSAVQPPTPNRTELQLKHLRPYVSVILYDLRAWWDHSEDLVDEVEARIDATIFSRHKQGDRLNDYGPIAKTTFHRWITTGRWHSVQTIPSWMAEVKAESIPHGDHGSEGTNQEPIDAA
jgi:hypothetical protein